MADYRVIFEFDPEGRFEACNGQPRPLTEEEYGEHQYFEYRMPIPYAQYLRYYGNPDRHVYLMACIERRCGCCGHWAATEHHLCGIDLMDDSPEYLQVELMQAYDPCDPLPGYLADVAADLFAEALAAEAHT